MSANQNWGRVGVQRFLSQALLTGATQAYHPESVPTVLKFYSSPFLSSCCISLNLYMP